MKRVYLYTGGIAKAHPIYKEGSRYVPEGFAYTPSTNELFASPQVALGRGVPVLSRLATLLTPSIIAALKVCRIPKVRLIRTPSNIALIHSAQYPLFNRTPWVMDFENAATIAWYDRSVLDSTITKTFFEHLFASSACRGLLAWTTAAKESMLAALDCSAFRDKIHVVHLTHVPKPWVDRSKKSGPMELLFYSGNFYAKGGLDVILVALKLAKHYDIHLTVISQYPPEVKEKFSMHPFITWKRQINAAERQRILSGTDILLHPGHSETYGYVILEAFSYGIPVISTDGFSSEELIESGVRGYVVKNFISLFDAQYLPTIRNRNDQRNFIDALRHPPEDYIGALADATAALIAAPDEWLRMSRNAHDSITHGLFSPSRRIESLSALYTNALRH